MGRKRARDESPGDTETRDESPGDTESASETHVEESQPEPIQVDPSRPKGIIYLSHIPASFTRSRVVDYFSRFGDVTNCWLNPEAEHVSKKRKQSGKVAGMTRRYLDGWVEFEEKAAAKKAAALDGHMVGGKSNLKKNPDYYDTWHIRYLPKFQWHNLETQEFYRRDKAANEIAVQMRHVSKQNFLYRQHVLKKAKHQG